MAGLWVSAESRRAPSGVLSHQSEAVEKRRNAHDNGQGSEGCHEDSSLRDALPCLRPSSRDIGVLRGWQGSHDGHRHEGRTLQPAIACGVGVLLGLAGPALMSVTIMAALPAAQNAYIAATRAKAGERIAQGTVLVATFASLPVVVGIAALFHRPRLVA